MRRTARSVKRNSKRISKRRTRKQSGGRIDMAKLHLVSKKRKRASKLANNSANKAQKLKAYIESVL